MEEISNEVMEDSTGSEKCNGLPKRSDNQAPKQRSSTRHELVESQKEILMHILKSTGSESSVEKEEVEEDKKSTEDDYTWVWDEGNKSKDVILCNEQREAYFHPDYSCGTAAVRGTLALIDGFQYYWEIEMSSAVYGTDMMIGIGTADVELDKYKSQFCSMLGRDPNSWGLSYLGTFQKDGQIGEFTDKLERGTIIGVHLDMWNGTLSFFRDGIPLGIAAKGLQGKVLYPIIASTAARTRMKLECSHSSVFSLQYLCMKEISKHIEHSPEAVEHLPLSKGLKKHFHQNISWLSLLNNCPLTPGPRRKKQRRKIKS